MSAAAEPEMSDSEKQYQYKPNKNFSIAVLRDTFISMVVEDDPGKRDRLFARLISLISKNTVPIRPDRPTQPRKSNRTKHRKRMSKKSPL